jgi:hypothetical protein
MTAGQGAEIIGPPGCIVIAVLLIMVFVIFHVIYQFRVSRAGRRP